MRGHSGYPWDKGVLRGTGNILVRGTRIWVRRSIGWMDLLVPITGS